MDDIELERLKMYQDAFKHMTTFSSGAILLAAAVTGALFLPEPDSKLHWAEFLGASIVLLAIGAAAAMFGLGFVSWSIDAAARDRGRTRSRGLQYVLWISVGAAYLGIASFAWFAVTNLAPRLFPSPWLITTPITAF